MNERLRELYQEQIMKHSREPFNEGELDNATHVLKAYNPLCGDKYSLFLEVDENNTVREASFNGFGCAISKASSSVLVKSIIGRTLKDISEIISTFLDIIDHESSSDPAKLTEDPDLLAFSVARKFPERKECASLSWDEMNKFIKENKG